MIRSLAEASKYEVNNEEIENAVGSMMEQLGLKRDVIFCSDIFSYLQYHFIFINDKKQKVLFPLFHQSKVSFGHFQKLMSHPENKKALGYANLNFTGVQLPEETQSQMKGSRKSYVDTARQTVTSIYGG